MNSTPVLADYVAIEDRFARSVNLTRDFSRIEPLKGYIVTDRTKHVLQRVAKSAASGVSGGSWSLTGPYGSGKSSLAILINSAFGPPSEARDLSWHLIEESAPEILNLIKISHRRYGTNGTGFYRALVTANQESICQTILRALHSAVIQRFGKIPPSSSLRSAPALKRLIGKRNIEETIESISATVLLEIAKNLAEDSPLLLVIDEFGKCLEAIRDDDENDPYLLQQIAELGQTPESPIFFITLQHQSFENYFEGTHPTRQREWNKVQGRFEEISFIESAGQSRVLIESVFSIESKAIGKRVGNWATIQQRKIQATSITEFDTADSIAACYPLHPLTALVLPEICNRFGQHERTMFSFLSGEHACGVATFLKSATLDEEGSLPSVGVEVLYDFFVSENTLANFSSSQTSRWIEIVTRLRDTHGLSNQELALVKTIAILNLVSMAGAVRASLPILSLVHSRARKNIEKLKQNGLVNYREYADEYRIWQGTDIDIDNLYSVAYRNVQQRPLVDILREIDAPSPMIAARHSAQFETLRIFSRRYVGHEEIVEPLSASSPFDGEVLLVIGKEVPLIQETKKLSKPIVGSIPDCLDDLDQITREVAAVTLILNEEVVKNDWVARRELEERLADRKIVLDNTIHTTFQGSNSRWMILSSNHTVELPIGHGSYPLSVAADNFYASTPIFRNEMINRTKLSTQGAKARRLVLEGMLNKGSEDQLGITGFGPEVAIYKAVLQETGIHRTNPKNLNLAFSKPTDETLVPAWRVIQNELNRAKNNRVNISEIFDTLRSPPIGMKLGVISIFFTAALLVFRDRIAIYEHGTFKPLLTADLSERMVKNPNHFDIKHFANTTGSRQQIIKELSDVFGLKHGYRAYRVSNVLGIVNYLVSQIRPLTKFALQTRNISSMTIVVREELLSAVEPDKFVFESLPAAVGLPSISVDERNYEHVEELTTKIKIAFDELTQCFECLLKEIYSVVLKNSLEPNRKAITGIAASLEDEILNPETKAFTNALAEDKSTNMEWAKTIATIVLKKAPTEWNDNDVKQFQFALSGQMSSFRRLAALHVEHRADGGGEFRPLRVTFTATDGTEFVDLVSIDDRIRNAGSKVLKHCLYELEKLSDSPRRARAALLALIGDEVLPEMQEDNENSNRDFERRKTDDG